MSEQPVAGADEDAGARYVMDKPCNFPQLHAEFAQALPNAQFEYQSAKTDGTPYGPDNPLTIIVRPANTSSKKINAVLTAHTPNDFWNVSGQLSECHSVALKASKEGFSSLTDDEKECFFGALAGMMAANPEMLHPHGSHDTTQ